GLLGLSAERILLQRQGDGLRVMLAGEDGSSVIGVLPWARDEAMRQDDVLVPLLPPRQASLPRWLLLPANAGLRRRLALPSAAAERLRDVTAFEIDRQTPFSAADVHHDARIVARHGDRID